MNKQPIVFAGNNISLFIASNYTPDTSEECEKSILKSLDVLVASVQAYHQSEKTFPRFLILRDHVAVNIVLDCMYFFKEELQAKLSEREFRVEVNKKMATSSSVNDLYKTISAELPDYSRDHLMASLNSLIDYMDPDDGKENYLIYRLDAVN